jgi:sulfatase maturation enzyme AslB (radical SAM superfamily)
MKCTAEFLFQYIETIAEHRLNRDFHVSFTGGEPTVNPNFIELVSYIHTRYNTVYKDKFDLHLSLTTNGAMGEKLVAGVVENFDYVTVSYHCEAHDTLKTQVKKRIEDFFKAGLNIKVNVMFHANHFDECKDLCEWLKEKGIKFVTSSKNRTKRYTQINGDIALCQKANQQFNWHGDFIFESAKEKEFDEFLFNVNDVEEKYYLSEKVANYVLSSGTKNFKTTPKTDLNIALGLGDAGRAHFLAQNKAN